MVNILFLLAMAKHKLSPITDVPQLEADILLSHVLHVPRSYLHAWPERVIEKQQQESFFHLLNRRLQGEPIAYITSHKEFWSLDLIVTPDVLIPRPETELLVELVLEQIPAYAGMTRVADLGTGSGAIALSLAHERPYWEIHATDKSPAALQIAKYNVERLNLDRIIFHQGSWCAALPSIKFSVIVSNPPYIAPGDHHLTQGDVRFEPISALVSPEQGLQDIQQIIHQAKDYLILGGMLLLEHGFDQAEKVVNIFQKEGYTDINIKQDLAGMNRVVIASWKGFDID